MIFKLMNNNLLLYRDAYKKDWPKHNISFGFFDHFINRIDKFPEWDLKVHFYSVDENFSEDATFVFTNGYYIYFDSLTLDHHKLKKILEQIDFSGEKIFIAIKDEFRDLIHEIIDEKALEKLADNRFNAFYIDEGHYDFTNAEEYLKNLPNEFYIKDIPESYAGYIFKKNEIETVRSVEMIQTGLRYNPSTGIFRKSDDRLIAWVIMLEFAMPANFHVDAEYRKQKLGYFVVCANFLRVMKEKKYYNALIAAETKASNRIAFAGGSEIIDKRSSIVVRKLGIVRGKL